MLRGFFSGLYRRICRFYSHLLDGRGFLAGLVRVIFFILFLPVISLREFSRNFCPQRAAFLAFTTLLALVPLIAVAFSVFMAFGPLKGVKENIQEMILDYFLPSSVQRVQSHINNYVNKLAEGSAVSGLIGLAFLIITVILLFNGVEKVLNQIWKIRSKRSTIRKFQAFWSVITLTPVLIGLSVWLTSKGLGELEGLSWGREFVRVGRLGTGIICSFFAFYFLYQFVPFTRVRFVSAALGAAVAAFLWEAAKQGFNLYVKNFVSYEAVYESLALVPIFLIWLFFTWNIALYGAVLAFVHQNRRRLRPGMRGEARAGILGDSFLLLSTLALLHLEFRKTRKGVPCRNLAWLLNLPEEKVEVTLEDLENRGYIIRVRDRERSYVPSAFPKEVSLSTLLSQQKEGEGAYRRGGIQELDDILVRMDQARLRALEGLTLADVLREERGVPHALPESPGGGSGRGGGESDRHFFKPVDEQ